MNTDKLTKDSLRRYIPNVVAEVDGEAPLFDKLAPFIDSAKARLEADYLGPDDFLREQHNELALKVLVASAFAEAVPSLDLILTPSGFGVVSTEAVAPASKERVERLISSLRDYADANLALLVDICRTYPEWRDSERGRWFGASLFPSLEDYNRLFRKSFTSYAEMREAVIKVESRLAERYLGRTLLAELRYQALLGKYESYSPVAVARTAVWSVLHAREKAADPNLLWHAAARVIEAVKYDCDLYELWHEEMGALFESPGFKNNINGGFYF